MCTEPRCECESQRMTTESQFSPATLWDTALFAYGGAIVGSPWQTTGSVGLTLHSPVSGAARKELLAVQKLPSAVCSLVEAQPDHSKDI